MKYAGEITEGDTLPSSLCLYKLRGKYWISCPSNHFDMGLPKEAGEAIRDLIETRPLSSIRPEPVCTCPECRGGKFDWVEPVIIPEKCGCLICALNRLVKWAWSGSYNPVPYPDWVQDEKVREG